MTKLERQLKIEQDAHEYSYNKFIQELSKRIQHGASCELPEGKMLLKATIDTVASKLIEYFKVDVRGKKKKIQMYLEDYFDRPKDLAYLLVNTTINCVHERGTIKVTSLCTQIAKALNQNFLLLKFKQQQPKLYSYIEREFKTRGKSYVHSRKTKLGMCRAGIDGDYLSKDSTLVASTLIDIILKSGCNLIEQELIKKSKSKSIILKYTPEAFKMIINAREGASLLYNKYPILIIPPADWDSLDGSLGYYSDGVYKGTAIKTRGNNKKLLRQYMKHKPPDRYLAILNKIQGTKWRINKRLFDVMDRILVDNIVDHSSQWNNPYLIGGLPYNEKQDPEDYVKVEDYGEIITEGKLAGLPKDKVMYKEWYKAKELQANKIVINNGKAITLNLAMIDARRYYDEPEIYFSYQSDFRGRIYPVQQHLNPQSKGEIKALLEFGNGYPIENDEQLMWFKIHGANCYGYDKLSYEDRVSEVDKLVEDIHNIASDPIRYRELWKDTDEPYLYLAWCFEYSDYLNNPMNFKSHIPIALDATCSGIQIYSGLLLDDDGAKAVNVTGNTREDIYQKVADKGNEYLATGDYKKEISFKKSDGTINICSTEAEANSMKGKISRKLTKSNTMTQPYSVTSYGMYQQIIEVLNEMEDSGNVIWRGDKWVLARLLTDINDRAIVATVKGARIGQEFLKQVTKDITARGEYIFYTTPIMEFPVLQKIPRYSIDRVRTELGQLSIRKETDDINNIKMVNGIAPNYIHSLDSTLMFLTIEKMYNEVGDYHLIHDSFGVPITYVPLLNTSVREAYIELFKSKPLHRFIKQVDEEFLDEVDKIMINTLDLDEVRDSKYIFS